MNELQRDLETLSEKVAQLNPKQLRTTLRGAVKGELKKVARKVTKQALSTSLNVDPTEFKKRSVRARVKNDLSGGFVTVKAGNQYMGLSGQYKTRHRTKVIKWRIGKSPDRYKPIAMWSVDGTEKRKTKDGRNRGSMPDYHFFHNGGILMKDVEKGIEKAIDKRIKKIGL